ncbi:DUF3892 domain-containing protein [Spongiibacter marinus]|uniref:DUF3892 domain-containing protein n=1 Tax=Spongiibacter marinus TaxID=354246 RepID=UPI000483EC2A|nr:DUF3892 domain-containing protein [Spongiibacter marinus]
MAIEIKCINKQDRYDPSERITHVGGLNDDMSRWKLTQKEAIEGIDNGKWEFYVGTTLLGRAQVVVRTSRFGNKYLTTEPDGETQNNLLSLPECP